MKYVSALMFIWFFIVTVATIYGMIVANKANKFDVAIGFIISPVLAFFALFMLVGGYK